MTKSSWTLTVEEVEGEYVLTFPNDLLQQMHWGEGDTLKWNIDDDGTVTLTKVDHGQN